MDMTHTREKVKVRGHSVQEIEWKEVDRMMDIQTELIALPSLLMRSVNIL